jgi:hypothetical protein
MLKGAQEESALDLSIRLMDVLQLSDLTYEEQRDILLAVFLLIHYKIFDFYPLKTSQCDQFILTVVKWSAKLKQIAAGDPSLHHIFGARCMQEGQVYDAEYHFLYGTIDSIKLLVTLETDLALDGKHKDKGYFAARAILPLLLLGRFGDAMIFLERFGTHFLPTDWIPEREIDGIKLSVHPLYNFSLLLLQIIEKGSGEFFGSLLNQYQDFLKFDDYLLEVCNRFSSSAVIRLASFTLELASWKSQ